MVGRYQGRQMRDHQQHRCPKALKTSFQVLIFIVLEQKEHAAVGQLLTGENGKMAGELGRNKSSSRCA